VTDAPTLVKFLELADRHLGRDAVRVVLELGARDCEETAAFSERLPQARVYAFECNPATLPACRERVAPLANVTLVEKAVADHDGDVSFFPINPERTVTTWEDGNPGASSLLRASGKYPAETYVQDEITVPAVTLETFLRDEGIDEVDLMWMDIQGAELMALRGAGDSLARVKMIHTEVEFLEIYSGQALFAEVKRFLNDAGFLLAAFTHLGRYAGDAVFVQGSLLRGAAGARARAVDRVSPLARHLSLLGRRPRG